MMGAGVSANASWDGGPVTLVQNAAAELRQAPNGSTVLAFQNLTDTNSDGQLTLTSGASPPLALLAPAGTVAPTILVHNWGGNNLNLTNTSIVEVSITARLAGPGIPGTAPKSLPTGKDGLILRDGEAALGTSWGGSMRLVMALDSGAPGVFVVIGGPKKDDAGTNASVFALNVPSSSRMPAGYCVATSGATTHLDFSWAGRIFVIFLGPASLAETASQPTLCDLPQASVALLSL